MTRAAIYTRISEDPKSRGGKAVNVATQEKDGRALADRRGWDVAEVFTDNDLTAADPNVTRPAFEALLERVLGGDFERVIVYTQDRFVRLAADLERVIAIFSTAGAELVPVIGTTDFDSPEGKLYARFGTLLGSYEVEKIRLRVRRKMQDNAEKGLPPGGAAGYGFNADKLTICEPEAVRIKEAAERVLAGDALAAIARDWNEQGDTRRGQMWRPVTIRRILLAPRTAGLREHQGAVIGKAAWPAILDRETWDRVGAVLNSPIRRTAPSVVQKFLTGIARCGPCGQTLNHKTLRTAGGGPKPIYFCRHCYGTTVSSERVDETVRDMVLEAVDGSGLRDAIRQAQEADGSAVHVDTLADLERDLAEMAADVGEGRITLAEWRVARAGIERRMAAARSVLERRRSESVIDVWVGHGGRLADAWGGLPRDVKRSIVEVVFASLTVVPARRGFNRFDPERVVPVWRY